MASGKQAYQHSWKKSPYTQEVSTTSDNINAEEINRLSDMEVADDSTYDFHKEKWNRILNEDASLNVEKRNFGFAIYKMAFMDPFHTLINSSWLVLISFTCLGITLVWFTFAFL
jgi:hypothetical protein